jgi:hypothetical protein
MAAKLQAVAAIGKAFLRSGRQHRRFVNPYGAVLA